MRFLRFFFAVRGKEPRPIALSSAQLAEEDAKKKVERVGSGTSLGDAGWSLLTGASPERSSVTR
jgi:hypothetical protein